MSTDPLRHTTRVGLRPALFLAFLVGATLLGGCQRQLIQTPNLYAGTDIDPFLNCPPAAQNNLVDILYATDRMPEVVKGGGKEYGYLRSPSLAFGKCIVEIGKDVSWPVLVENSRSRKRTVRLPLSIQQIQELGRCPDTPVPLVKEGTQLVNDPRVEAAMEKVATSFRAELARRLAQTPRKEVFLFIHGYNTTFQDSIFVMADLWHFLGRTGIPVVYSWPAGRGGLRGYNYDRESGEFTVYHLRNFLKFLASCPEVEKIHLVAHSRGTDVLLSAIRELTIEACASGRDPRKAAKVEDMALAAADLDLEVFTQRVVADRLELGMKRITHYVSEEDKALGLSTWLSSGIKRVGKIAFEDLDLLTE